MAEDWESSTYKNILSIWLYTIVGSNFKDYVLKVYFDYYQI